MKQATERRVNLLFVITKATHGGAQKYVGDLATGLPRDVFDIVLAYGVRGELAESLEKRGIRTVRIASLGRDVALLSDIKSFFDMRALIKRVRPDVVHLNSSKAAAIGALASRFCGVPNIIFTAHGWPFKEDRGTLSRMLIYVASWLTALLAHTTIVVSKADQITGKKMPFVRNKIVHIPLGSERVEILPPPEGFKKMFGAQKPPIISQTTLRIVTIAELTRNKGIRYGIDAIKKLTERGRDAIYIVVGDGEERAALATYAGERGVADRVFFPGFVPNAAQYLSGFDVFLLPSRKEGMPYVLLEAADAGLPIVATSAIDRASTEHVPRIRVVPIGDSSAIADAIIEFSSLPRAPSRAKDGSLLATMLESTRALYMR